VQDQLARKVEDAAGRLKKRRERKGMWDEVNGGTNKFAQLAALVDEPGGEDKNEWEDMEDVEDENLSAKSNAKLVVVDRTAQAPPPPPPGQDEADKIT
jgi:hypothetical protein